MKIAYVRFGSRLEDELLKAFANRAGGEVKVGKDSLRLPIVANFSTWKMDYLKSGLGATNYKEVRFTPAISSAEELYERVGERIKLVLETCSKHDADLIIIYGDDRTRDKIKGAINICLQKAGS